MKCTNHENVNAAGACVGCGKLFCQECITEINDKNYCKKCLQNAFDAKTKEIEKLANKPDTPMVFMNAGGGSSSSSAASSSATGYLVKPPYPRQKLGIHLLLFLFTAGIGNIIYFIYIYAKQQEWKKM